MSIGVVEERMVNGTAVEPDEMPVSLTATSPKLLRGDNAGEVEARQRNGSCLVLLG